MKANPILRQHHQNGYALVMTLSLSALTLLAVLALLAASLQQSTIQRDHNDRNVAKMNAMLALDLALADLQREAGPDQRITATGDNLANSRLPHLTGVWDSWNHNPLVDPAPDYVAAKSTRFRKWLISGLSATEASDVNYPATAPGFPGSNQVELVGDGSVGQNATGAGHVHAGKVPLVLSDGRSSGKLAWAVLDEGVKARVNLPAVDTAKTKSNAEAMAVAGSPPRAAVEKADPSLASLADNQLELSGLPTLESIALLDGLPASTIKPFFHDLTTSATGVLADVANGGLRKDLSTMFDVSIFSNISEFYNRKLYSDSTTGLGPQDPWWDLFFYYFQMKTANVGAGMVSVLGLDGFDADRTYLASRFDLGFTDFQGGGTYISQNKKEITQKSTPIAPVIASCEMFYSAVAKQTHSNWSNQVRIAFGQSTASPPNFSNPAEFNHMIHLAFQPVITLWNPYNVPIRMTDIRIEIETPPLAFQFSRIPTVGPSTIYGVDISGVTSTTFIPLNQFYVYAGDRGKIKRFILSLYNDKPTGNNYPVDPAVTLQPGEVRVFSPSVPASSLWNSSIIGEDGNTVSLFDYVNQPIPQLRSAPGWNGFQYGFNINWLCPNHNNYYVTGKNGPVQHNGVLGSRLTDAWSIQVRPQAQIDNGGTPFKTYAVSLTDKRGYIYSRLEFFHDGDNTKLQQALSNNTGDPGDGLDSSGTLTCGPFLANDYKLGLTQPLSTANFFPLFSLSAQAKTAQSSAFPNKPFVHGNATRPLVVVDLTKQNQALNSHELTIRKFDTSGFQMDPNTDRGYSVGGREADTGTTLGTIRDTPNMPVQGVASLAHANIAGLSRYLPNVDGVVGQSFAHPLLPADVARFNSTALGYEVFDHSYLANWRLWDTWYASTIDYYNGPSFTGSTTRRTGVVAKDFFEPTSSSLPLLNPRFIPWLGSGGADQAIADISGTRTSTYATSLAYKKTAAYQMLSGAFNVNSTSVPAWKALLSCLNGAALPISGPVDAQASAFAFNKSAISQAAPYFAKTRLANALPVPRAAMGNPRWQSWQGGRELSDAELDRLANAIVDEVKLRGPFLSLAEFINRRLTSDKELALRGTLQAAIEKAGLGVSATLPGEGESLAAADVAYAGYAFPEAAQGSTAEGASASLDQLAVLTGIGTFLSARSDTFRIRIYGEATNAGGGASDRAYGEAVVQRVPDYVHNGDAAYNAPGQPDNQIFGRRFRIVAFRWLMPEEI